MAPLNLTFDNPAVRSYAFYAVVSIGKMGLLAFVTSARRGRKQAFVNPEDAKFFGKKKDTRTTEDDPDVERIRRNHLNDLENIPSHIIVGFCYLLTNPTPNVAAWHFRVFCISRIIHTLAYQAGLQPWKALAYLVGTATTVSMGAQVIKALL